jgi:integrase
MKGFSVWIEDKVTKSGKRYYVCWRTPDGQRGQVAAGPYKDRANSILRSKEDEFIRGIFDIPTHKMTVGELVTEYLAKIASTKAPNTVRIAQYAIKPFNDLYGGRKLSQVNIPLMEEFTQRLLLEKKSRANRLEQVAHSANGVDIIIRNIKTCLSYGVKMHYLSSNPLRGYKPPKTKEVARFLTADEKSKLLNACLFNPALKDIIIVALHTGMRMGEILKLRHSDVVGKRICVYQEKTNKYKMIPIHNSIRAILEKQPEQEYIFQGWAKWRLEQSFRRAVKRSKIGKLRFHDLRHTFASDYLRNGGTVLDLAKIMGVTLQVLSIYSHFQEDYLDERINGMEFVHSGKDSGNSGKIEASRSANNDTVKRFEVIDFETRKDGLEVKAG